MVRKLELTVVEGCTRKASEVLLSSTLPDNNVGKKVAIQLIIPRGDYREKKKSLIRRETLLKLLGALETSENIVTILNSEMKSSSVAIVIKLCTMDLHD